MRLRWPCSTRSFDLRVLLPYKAVSLPDTQHPSMNPTPSLATISTNLLLDPSPFLPFSLFLCYTRQRPSSLSFPSYQAYALSVAARLPPSFYQPSSTIFKPEPLDFHSLLVQTQNKHHQHSKDEVLPPPHHPPLRRRRPRRAAEERSQYVLSSQSPISNLQPPISSLQSPFSVLFYLLLSPLPPNLYLSPLAT